MNAIDVRNTAARELLLWVKISGSSEKTLKNLAKMKKINILIHQSDFGGPIAFSTAHRERRDLAHSKGNNLIYLKKILPSKSDSRIARKIEFSDQKSRLGPLAYGGRFPADAVLLLSTCGGVGSRCSTSHSSAPLGALAGDS